MKVEDFPMMHKEVVQIDVLTSVEDAIKKLVDANVSSLPVYDYAEKRYRGSVDISDFVQFLVQSNVQGGVAGSKLTDCFSSLRNLLSHVALHTGKKVLDLIDISKNNPFVAVNEGDRAIDAIKILARGIPSKIDKMPDTSVHRVPIMRDNKCVRILSQSSVIQYIGYNMEKLGDLQYKTVEELGLAYTKRLVTVSVDDMALKAFELMIANRLSAIPIMKDGKLFTNISNSDVKLALHGDFISNAMLNMVGENVLDFVTKCRTKVIGPKPGTEGASAASRYGKSFPAAVTVKPDDTLNSVIGKLAATGLHRLYVVDDDRHLVGVVSLKDVLKVVV